MAGFNDIVGNSHIVEHFTKAIENDKVSHAYIINGEKGMGKKTIANAFAMTLLCEENGVMPCMKCHSCVQALSGNNPDIIYIRPDKINTLSIDHIREKLVNDVAIKPYRYSHKVYIVENAELMNVQAQNAILKTIEEPPEYAIIILLSSNADIFLQTVRSRCVILDMQPLKNEQIKNYLMINKKVVDYQADIATNMSGGNLGRAIDYAVSQDFSDMLSEVIRLMKYIKEMQVYEVVAAVRKVSEFNFRPEEYIDLIMLWFRDVLVYKASLDVNKLIFKDEIITIKEYASGTSYNGIELVLDALEKAKLRLKANVNFDITIEMMFLAIRENI